MDKGKNKQEISKVGILRINLGGGRANRQIRRHNMILTINGSVIGNVVKKYTQNNQWVFETDELEVYAVPFKVLALPPRIRGNVIIVETKEV